MKLDIDNVHAPTLRDVTQLLRRAGYKPVAFGECRSPSGNGWHVWIHVTPQPQSPYEVVALEAILGGDRQRCAIQMHRARVFPKVPSFMRNAWNVLYRADPQRRRHVTLPTE